MNTTHAFELFTSVCFAPSVQIPVPSQLSCVRDLSHCDLSHILL